MKPRTQSPFLAHAMVVVLVGLNSGGCNRSQAPTAESSSAALGADVGGQPAIGFTWSTRRGSLIFPRFDGHRTCIDDYTARWGWFARAS